MTSLKTRNRPVNATLSSSGPGIGRWPHSQGAQTASRTTATGPSLDQIRKCIPALGSPTGFVSDLIASTERHRVDVLVPVVLDQRSREPRAEHRTIGGRTDRGIAAPVTLVSTRREAPKKQVTIRSGKTVHRYGDAVAVSVPRVGQLRRYPL